MKKLIIPLNVPNILTLVRLLMIPFVVWCALNDRMTLGLVIYTAACGTDVLDGWIARRFGLISDAGKLLDPLADKLLIMAVVATFAYLGILPVWMVVIIWIKELFMIVSSYYMLKKDIVVFANWAGKITALLTHIAIGLAFLNHFYGQAYIVVMSVAIVATLVSLVQYVRIAFLKEGLVNKDVSNNKIDEQAPDEITD